MGCQAVPLHAPRELPVLEGKVCPFPRCLKRTQHPRGANCCRRPLPARSGASPIRLQSGGETPSLSSLAHSGGERHDTEPMGRRRDLPRGLARIPPSSSEGPVVRQVPQEQACRAGGLAQIEAETGRELF